MANELKFVYETGATLLSALYYDNSGTMTLREANITMTEQPASSGIYKGSPSAIVEGDVVKVTESGITVGAAVVSKLSNIEEIVLETASMQYTLDYLLRILLESSVMITTTIATLSSQTSFTLTAGSPDDDAYNNCMIIIKHQSVAKRKAIGLVSDYTGSSLTITLVKDPGIFTMSVGDELFIMSIPADIIDTLKLIRADKVIDITETPWVVDCKEEGTETVLMSKTMKNTVGDDIVNKDNVLGRLEKE